MVTAGFSALVEGLKKSCLALEQLKLKIGAEVMFIKNDTSARYVNGTRSIVVGFDKSEGWPIVKTYDNEIIIAYPEEWKYEDNGVVRATITQVSLRLAWAITIHKSQGMTLDAAEIDLGDAFEPGMGYVALSRVRSLSGLKLMNLNEMALKVHPKILQHDQVEQTCCQPLFGVYSKQSTLFMEYTPMLDSLKQTSHRLITQAPTSIYRYLYTGFNINERLTGIIGARGVGKTTLMLQYIKNNLYGKEPVMYCSADNLFFSTNTLWQLVESLYQEDHLKIFFIDEVHKYPNWQQELKNIYDSFPNIKVIFSGSSSINLAKGSYDLSRRVRLYHLAGLSFQEFLQFEQGISFPAVKFDELIDNYKKFDSIFAEITKLTGHWNNYLRVTTRSLPN